MYTVLRLNTGIYSSSDDLSIPLKQILKRKQNMTGLFKLAYGFDKHFYRLRNPRNYWSTLIWYYKFILWGFRDNRKQRMLMNLLMQDMINLYTVWRKVRGYPVRGQRTWSNGKTASTQTTPLIQYRVKQFLAAFGGKKRINFSTLAYAEYTNKFWLRYFTSEWLQSKKRLGRYLHRKTKDLQIDLINLSKGITAGYKRLGAASKLNKAKKQHKSATVGLPLFFSRFMYGVGSSKRFKFKIVVEQQQKAISKKPRKKKQVKKTAKKK